MSRTWSRSPVDTLCGHCPSHIRRGDPIFEIALPPYWRKTRCAVCAGEPVPADLPPLPERKGIEPTPRLTTPRRRGSRRQAERDWKHAQAGDAPAVERPAGGRL